jgi:hypothetical protein
MDELKGVGHFSFWFVLGYFLFVLIKIRLKNKASINLYGPFIPFILGITATLPYLMAVLGLVEHKELADDLYNIFLLYPMLNNLNFIVVIFSNFYFAIIFASIIYMQLLLHYIKLVKNTRKNYAK